MMIKAAQKAIGEEEFNYPKSFAGENYLTNLRRVVVVGAPVPGSDIGLASVRAESRREMSKTQVRPVIFGFGPLEPESHIHLPIEH
jgi:hypothetical protein